jgi:hypothetical protein
MIADFPTHIPQLKRARQRLSTASEFELGHHRTDAVVDCQRPRLQTASGFAPLERQIGETDNPALEGPVRAFAGRKRP